MESLFDIDEIPHILTIRERFEQFDHENPQVYVELERMTAAMVAIGRKRIGIAMLFEVLRWNYYMNTRDPSSEFRLNNDYRAWYSRVLIENHPEWEGLFQMREVHETSAILIRKKKQ